jgi:hypothetical protein
MLPPRDARGSSVHDASLAQRLSLSLGMHVSAAEQNQVMPLGAPDSETQDGSDSESSESTAEAGSETQQPAEAGTSAA